jgi:hypothetical protein
VEDESHHHLGADRVELEGEAGDDAEVPAAAAQSPEQVGVGAGVDLQHLAAGGDQLGADQIVAAHAVLVAQPAEAAAEGEAGDAGAGEYSARGR